MPRKLHNVLTALAVKNAKPGRHADGAGLHLLVKESGARSWVYRFMLHGKSRDVGLGAAGPGGIALADARDLAAALRLKVRSGIDPLEERQREASERRASAQAEQMAGITFKAVAEAYIAANEASWRNSKHRQQWRNTLASYVYPVMGDLPVAAIGTAHVLKILEPIWQDKPETASRIRGRIETVLDAAKARGYREGENPARWRGHIAQILPARSRLTRGHHPALPYEHLPTFIRSLRQREALAALALEVVILTATRSNEVLAATWAEFDLDKAGWIIPATRMKGAKEHRVPLSPRVVEILEAVKPLGSKLVFPGSKGGQLSTMAMAMLLRRMHDADLARGGAGHFDPKQGRAATVHGFRSSFRDWADEQTAYPHEMKEMALAHTIGNKSEAAYRRGDMFEKRRRLMDDWAGFCGSRGAVGGNVMPIRKAESR